MPQARRSTSTRSRSPFKHPPALKRLSTSLETAQKALTELSKGSGRDVSKGAGDLYKDLRAFVSNARRESNKLGKALQREFDQAQKQLAKAAKASTPGRSGASGATSKRSTSSRSASSRSASKRPTSARSTSARSTASRSASSRASSSRSTASGRGSTKRSSAGGTKRTSGKRGSSKS